MLIVVSKVKQLAKEYGKQVTKEYLERLDTIVKDKIIKSTINAKHFKRLTHSELM
jgi:hypothetical protein